MLQSIEDIFECSDFVKRSIVAMKGCADKAELERIINIEFSRESIRERLSRVTSAQDLGLMLRILRRELIVHLVACNLMGKINYYQVVNLMTEFAEVAIDVSVRFHALDLATRFGVPTSKSGVAQDLIVFGMGKLGGKELNVSSDIDLVFIYDEDGETKAFGQYQPRRTITNYEFFERLAKRVIPFLNNPEGPGFVFRVDMRLRPNGDSGPIVCSSGMLEEYLYSQGRDWERFAWLKARVVNEPIFTEEKSFRQIETNLVNLIRPFVFRKYLDFNAITSLISLHDLVRQEQDKKEFEKKLDGLNVKLGAGGIREIEFLVQTIQVIRGGRQPLLRNKETLKTLDILADEGILDKERSQRLKSAYVYLRDIEHCLQYINDEQTQFLPLESEITNKVARMMGASSKELLGKVKEVMSFVKASFESVFKVNEEKSQSEDDWPIDWQQGGETTYKALLQKMESLNYASSNMSEIAQRIASFVGSKKVTLLSEETRRKLFGLIQFVVEGSSKWIRKEISEVVTPNEALTRYLKLIEAIVGRSTYISLLYQYPEAAKRVGDVLVASNTTADYIVAHPIVLDDLVDARTNTLDSNTAVSYWDSWKKHLDLALEEKKDDQEAQMNILRDYYHSAVFQIMTADIYGKLTVERVSDHLSILVDYVLQKVVDWSWSYLKGAKGNPNFAVIGYGKLGGKELGYESDLDLVFLFDDKDQDAVQLYSKLVRKMMSWLTLQTSSGKLFTVDLRLRPNGEDGLTVSDISYFESYQENKDGTGAWVWEHQAISRARFVAGDLSLGKKFEDIRRKVLSSYKNKEELAQEIIEMRLRMLTEKKKRVSIKNYFDVKHTFGGMIDIEFIVQYLVLLYSRQYPSLMENIGNIALLGRAANFGLIPVDLAKSAQDAYRKYRCWQHAIRLNGGEDAPVRVRKDLAQDCSLSVRDLWKQLFGVKPNEE